MHVHCMYICTNHFSHTIPLPSLFHPLPFHLPFLSPPLLSLSLPTPCSLFDHSQHHFSQHNLPHPLPLLPFSPTSPFLPTLSAHPLIGIEPQCRFWGNLDHIDSIASPQRAHSTLIEHVSDARCKSKVLLCHRGHLQREGGRESEEERCL